MRPFTKLTSTAAIGACLVLACRFTESNPEHCGNNDGDAYCARLPSSEALPYCEAGTPDCTTPGHERHGCVAERPPDACYRPCGGGRTPADEACPAGSDTVETTTLPSTTGDPTTGGPSTGDPSTDTMGPAPCTVDDDCAEPMPPFCDADSGQCVPCDALGAAADARCAALDPLAPLCVDGACVPCTAEDPAACDEQRLLCDGATHTCVPCTGHEQCASGACELAVGQCFPSDALRLEVDGDGPADHTSISMAVSAVDEPGYGVIVVHELNGGAAYGPCLVTGRTIALLAAPGEQPIIQSVVGNPALRVLGPEAALYMDGPIVSDNPAGMGVLVESEALAWIDRSRIVRNAGGGIVVRSHASLTLRNCFVGGANDEDAISVHDATIDVLYSTIGANFGISRALACEGTSTATLRNSLLASLDVDYEVQCPGVVASHTASEFGLIGVGNVELGAVSTDWFTSYEDGDFHLDAPPIEIVSAARWDTDDPGTDIDGDPRPQRDGASDFVGADVP